MITKHIKAGKRRKKNKIIEFDIVKATAICSGLIICYICVFVLNSIIKN